VDYASATIRGLLALQPVRPVWAVRLKSRSSFLVDPRAPRTVGPEPASRKTALDPRGPVPTGSSGPRRSGVRPARVGRQQVTEDLEQRLNQTPRSYVACTRTNSFDSFRTFVWFGPGGTEEFRGDSGEWSGIPPLAPRSHASCVLAEPGAPDKTLPTLPADEDPVSRWSGLFVRRSARSSPRLSRIA